MALRAALRQAPSVILVSESGDRETTDMMLEAAETGHLVLSSLNAVDATKSLERITGMFSMPEQPAIRGRLAKSLRCIISQRLIPRRDALGRVPIVEILKVHSRTLEGWKSNTSARQVLQRAMKDGASDGMQHFDAEIEKLVRAGVVDRETALTHATDPEELRKSLSDLEL
jgi:twitching motility protein PilT